MAKYAFIGAGNMGGAILRSAALALPDDEFIVYVRRAELAERLRSELRVTVADSIADAAGRAGFVFLCVKPQYAAEPLAELAPVLRNSGKTLVSIMAGVSAAKIRGQLGEGNFSVVRVMPNMPALVGKGLTAIADTAPLEVAAVFSTCGEVVTLPESQLDAETAVAGCAPAFAFMFTEALADAGVYAGLSRSDATRFAALALRGAAEMVLDGGSPAALKDTICSPGGSTVRGVAELENSGFRGAVMRAAVASWVRNKELGA